MLKSLMETFHYVRNMRQLEEEIAEKNPYLTEALEREKHEGHRVAVILRTIALVIVMLYLPFVVQGWYVLYTEFLLSLLIGLGWLQYQQAAVGYSKVELRLIMLDIVLITLIILLPNPFDVRGYPNAFVYRFDPFIYFFIILATSTLAYSWRTVWAIGLWVSVTWIAGAVGIYFFGYTIPEWGEAIRSAFSNVLNGDTLIADYLDPNSVLFSQRIQEIIFFIVIAAILAAKGFRSNLLLMRQADIAAERANLSRYFPPNTVESLASSSENVGAVKNQEVAVLFTDIVGFTKFAESNPPEEVLELLKDYNSIIERAVFDHGGTLEKYIGDGVMATFGRPVSSPDDALNALKACRQIAQQMETFGAGRVELGKQPVKVSVGLHYGPVIMGDIGPDRRMEFAVIGDTVNVAARLEASSRELGCKCVVSDDLISKLNGHAEEYIEQFSLKKNVKLKGRERPVNVWIN